MCINILLIEDDEKIREIIKIYTNHEGFLLQEADNSATAYVLLEENLYDLVLLDVMLPDTDGWSILRKLKSDYKNLPVIMLTARSDENDKLLGFELGADDYVTKPFSSKVLMARIKRLISREAEKVVEQVNIGPLTIDSAFHCIRLNEKRLELTPLEYDLFIYLLNNRNIALKREQILTAVWGYDYFGDIRTVDTHIKRLRRKLGKYDKVISTVRGFGYRLELENKL